MNRTSPSLNALRVRPTDRIDDIVGDRGEAAAIALADLQAFCTVVPSDEARGHRRERLKGMECPIEG